MNRSQAQNDLNGLVGIKLANDNTVLITYNTIMIIGYHSYHTGIDGKGISEADNDKLAQERSQSTFNYLNSTYPGIWFPKNYMGINNYQYRRAIVYTTLGMTSALYSKLNSVRVQY